MWLPHTGVNGCKNISWEATYHWEYPVNILHHDFGNVFVLCSAHKDPGCRMCSLTTYLLPSTILTTPLAMLLVFATEFVAFFGHLSVFYIGETLWN